MGRGKVKGQLSLRLVGTLVVRERMGKALQCRVAAHCQRVGAPAPPDLDLHWKGRGGGECMFVCECVSALGEGKGVLEKGE